MFQEFDGINCLGSYYVRKTQLLESEDPEPHATVTQEHQGHYLLCQCLTSLLDFVRSVTNPFIMEASGVRLHYFSTEHLINDEIMDLFEKGEKIQTGELVFKTKKLAVTIHRCNLPKSDTVGN